jgi:hypothetical protein
VKYKPVRKFSFFPIIKLGEDEEEMRKRQGRDEEEFVIFINLFFSSSFPSLSLFLSNTLVKY